MRSRTSETGRAKPVPPRAPLGPAGIHSLKSRRRSASARWGLGWRLLIAAAGFAIYLALLLLKWTTRWRLVGGDWLLEEPAASEPLVFAFWHDRLVMMPLLVTFRSGICVMNSQHRDGEIITRAIERLGVEVVRGSSTRGWSRALRGMLAAHGRGLDLAMVVDGPKGPRHVAKGGAIQLAQATGRRVVPLTYAPSHAVRLRSWDRLLIPLPLSRIVFVAGRPIVVSPQASASDKEEATRRLGDELGEITSRAERLAQGR